MYVCMYVKHERQTVFITFQDSQIERFGNSGMRSRVFLTGFRMSGIVMKLCFECLIEPVDQN